MDLATQRKIKYLRRESAEARAKKARLIAEGVITKEDKQFKLQQEIEALEEQFGIDGVKPSERGKFHPVAVIGTTAYSAFQPPTLRAISNGEYERV